MKKNVVITLVLILSQFVYSQTKTETTNWLLKELNKHQKVDDEYGYAEYSVMNGNFFSKTFFDSSDENSSGIKFTSVFGIPLKYVSEIVVSKDDKSFKFELVCKNNCGNQTINSITGKVDVGEFASSSHLKINNDDKTLYARIPKALIHLIKLYGGNAKLIFFKEPF